MKLRQKVTINGVFMFVVAGCLSRSGRAGYMELLSKLHYKFLDFRARFGYRSGQGNQSGRDDTISTPASSSYRLFVDL